MIIHKHADGSEGHQYQLGDKVIVERTIHGGWFDYGPTHSNCCTVEKIESKDCWRIAKLIIRYSPEWGPAECLPWMLKPTAETILTASVLEVENA